MAIPLKRDDKTIGMIALANKKSGYTRDDQNAIEMLSVAFMEAIAIKITEISLKKVKNVSVHWQNLLWMP